MALQGRVDWRGRPVNPKRHGGVKATLFIYVLIVLANIANIPLILNLVSYLTGTMHMGIKDASTTSTNFFGAICFFSFLGAFISDSYIKRFYTILIFAPVEILGYILLACQAYFPSLHPPPCDIINHPEQCVPVSGKNLSLLSLGLYMITIGEGSLRACAAALGGDQFDDDDPVEMRSKTSYFNWFTFCISLGGFSGLVFMVWVQDNEGWGLSFILAAVMIFFGTVVVVGGLPFYRHQKPAGSPLARILQVFVAAFRKRKLSLPENPEEMHEISTDGANKSAEFIERTSGFKFLDKAAVKVNDGDARLWSLCTVTQVEETKIIIRMLPIFISSILGNVSIPLLLALTVQQGGTMDTRLGATKMPPASLFIVPIVFQMLILVVYDRFAVPWLRRLTGYSGGVTNLQRVGVGFLFSVVALVVAAVVERQRRSRVSTTMSVFWLTPQFFLLGVMDVTSFVGLLEFFYSEASAGMKSIGSAIVFGVLGVASWLGSFLIQVVNRVTASQEKGHGWLDGATLDESRLDLFYWFLAVFALVSFVVYLFCAWLYTYRHDPRLQTISVDSEKAPLGSEPARQAAA